MTTVLLGVTLVHCSVHCYWTCCHWLSGLSKTSDSQLWLSSSVTEHLEEYCCSWTTCCCNLAYLESTCAIRYFARSCTYLLLASTLFPELEYLSRLVSISCNSCLPLVLDWKSLVLSGFEVIEDSVVQDFAGVQEDCPHFAVEKRLCCSCDPTGIHYISEPVRSYKLQIGVKTVTDHPVGVQLLPSSQRIFLKVENITEEQSDFNAFVDLEILPYFWLLSSDPEATGAHYISRPLLSCSLKLWKKSTLYPLIGAIWFDFSDYNCRRVQKFTEEEPQLAKTAPGAPEDSHFQDHCSRGDPTGEHYTACLVVSLELQICIKTALDYLIGVHYLPFFKDNCRSFWTLTQLPQFLSLFWYLRPKIAILPVEYCSLRPQEFLISLSPWTVGTQDFVQKQLLRSPLEVAGCHFQLVIARPLRTSHRRSQNLTLSSFGRISRIFREFAVLVEPQQFTISGNPCGVCCCKFGKSQHLKSLLVLSGWTFLSIIAEGDLHIQRRPDFAAVCCTLFFCVHCKFGHIFGEEAHCLDHSCCCPRTGYWCSLASIIVVLDPLQLPLLKKSPTTVIGEDILVPTYWPEDPSEESLFFLVQAWTVWISTYLQAWGAGALRMTWRQPLNCISN